MKTRVKSTKFDNQHMTLARDFLRQSFAANVFAGYSISSHNIALFLFNNKIRFNQWKNIIQHWSSCLPGIDWSRKLFLACPSITRLFITSKYFFKPYNQLFITTRYLKHAMPLMTVAIFSLLCITDINATFSINDTSKIGDFRDGMICFKKNIFCHELPFNDYYTVIIEKVYVERLNEKAFLQKGCDSLNSDRKTEREIRRGFPA